MKYHFVFRVGEAYTSGISTIKVVGRFDGYIDVIGDFTGRYKVHTRKRICGTEEIVNINGVQFFSETTDEYQRLRG